MLPLTAEHRQLASDKVLVFRNDKLLTRRIVLLPNRYLADDSLSAVFFTFSAPNPRAGPNLLRNAEGPGLLNLYLGRGRGREFTSGLMRRRLGVNRGSRRFSATNVGGMSQKAQCVPIPPEHRSDSNDPRLLA